MIDCTKWWKIFEFFTQSGQFFMIIVLGNQWSVSCKHCYEQNGNKPPLPMDDSIPESELEYTATEADPATLPISTITVNTEDHVRGFDNPLYSPVVSTDAEYTLLRKGEGFVPHIVRRI